MEICPGTLADSIVQFTGEFMPILVSNTVNFYTSNMWDYNLNPQLACELLQLTDEDLAKFPSGRICILEENESKDDKYPLLRNFIHKMRKNRLQLLASPIETTAQFSLNSSNSSSRGLAVERDARSSGRRPEENSVTLSTPRDKEKESRENAEIAKRIMGKKKSHEVAAMAQKCASLMSAAGIKQVVDIGSGKGYLGQFLSMKYGINVISVDSSETNTNGALKRSNRLSKQWRGIVRNATGKSKGRTYTSVEDIDDNSKSTIPLQDVVEDGCCIGTEESQREDVDKKQNTDECIQDPNGTSAIIGREGSGQDPSSSRAIKGAIAGGCDILSSDIFDSSSISSKCLIESTQIQVQSFSIKEEVLQTAMTGFPDMQQHSTSSSISPAGSPTSLSASSSSLSPSSSSSLLVTSSTSPSQPAKTNSEHSALPENSSRASKTQQRPPPASCNQPILQLPRASSTTRKLSKAQEHSQQSSQSESNISINNSSQTKTGHGENETISPNSVEETGMQEEGRIEAGALVLITGYVDEETELGDFLQCDENAKHFDPTQPFMMVGLHTCGDLAPSMLRIFQSNPSMHLLCNVGCCYHHLTEEFARREGWDLDHPGVQRGASYGFPMSHYLREKKVALGRDTRMMACMAADRIASEKTVDVRGLFYRAVLQVICSEHFTIPTRKQIIGKLAPKCKSFLEYTRRALKKLQMDDSKLSDEEITSYEAKYKPYYRNLAAYNQLRAALSPSIEALILLDRLLYLKEQPNIKTASIVQLFDPVTSPRCYGIIAVKGTTC